MKANKEDPSQLDYTSLADGGVATALRRLAYYVDTLTLLAVAELCAAVDELITGKDRKTWLTAPVIKEPVQQQVRTTATRGRSQSSRLP